MSHHVWSFSKTLHCFIFARKIISRIVVIAFKDSSIVLLECQSLIFLPLFVYALFLPQDFVCYFSVCLKCHCNSLAFPATYLPVHSWECCLANMRRTLCNIRILCNTRAHTNTHIYSIL